MTDWEYYRRLRWRRDVGTDAGRQGVFRIGSGNDFQINNSRLFYTKIRYNIADMTVDRVCCSYVVFWKILK